MYQCRDCGIVFDIPSIDTGVDATTEKLVEYKGCIKCGSESLKTLDI